MLCIYSGKDTSFGTHMSRPNLLLEKYVKNMHFFGKFGVGKGNTSWVRSRVFSILPLNAEATFKACACKKINRRAYNFILVFKIILLSDNIITIYCGNASLGVWACFLKPF